MKTFNHLWPQIIAWDNIVAAYRRCRKRKRFLSPACRFDFAWESELRTLQAELVSETYRPGDYHHFFIEEPKRRKISAAPFRDRIVHHLVVSTLEPIFDRRFIFDSYACRTGKGTHRAVHRTQSFLKRFPYYLKTDIVRFFPNVDHAVLLAILERRIVDPKLRNLIRRIIASGEGVLTEEATNEFFPGDDLLDVLRPRGLPIGNLTSQFFANVLLDQADHYIKETLRVPGYVRYADDLILFGTSKQQLWDWKACLTDRLDALRLKLHAKKTVVRPSACGVNYLGFHISRQSRRLTQDCLRRFNRRLRQLRWQYHRRLISFPVVISSIQAWQAHANNANSKGIQRILLKKAIFTKAPRVAKCDPRNG